MWLSLIILGKLASQNMRKESDELNIHMTLGENLDHWIQLIDGKVY
jgi:hypothetical protein